MTRFFLLSCMNFINRWSYFWIWALRCSCTHCRARWSPSAPAPVLHLCSLCALCSSGEQRQCRSRTRWDKCGTQCPHQLYLEKTCAFVLDKGQEPHMLSWLVSNTTSNWKYVSSINHALIVSTTTKPYRVFLSIHKMKCTLKYMCEKFTY